MSSKNSYNRGHPKNSVKDNIVYIATPEEQRKKNRQYFRVFRSTINHPKFCKMSVHAQMLYIRIGAYCCMDQGYYRKCTYQKAEYTKQRIRPDTFRKAKKELLKYGFIQEKTGTKRGSKSEYRLSDNWYRYDGEVPEGERYYL